MVAFGGFEPGDYVFFTRVAGVETGELRDEIFEEDTIPVVGIGCGAFLGVVEEVIAETGKRGILLGRGMPAGPEDLPGAFENLRGRVPAPFPLDWRLFGRVFAELDLLAGGELDIPGPGLLPESGFLHDFLHFRPFGHRATRIRLPQVLI